MQDAETQVNMFDFARLERSFNNVNHFMRTCEKISLNFRDTIQIMSQSIKQLSAENEKRMNTMKDEVNKVIEQFQRHQPQGRQESAQARQQRTVASSTPLPTFTTQQRVRDLRELCEPTFENTNSMSYNEVNLLRESVPKLNCTLENKSINNSVTIIYQINFFAGLTP